MTSLAATEHTCNTVAYMLCLLMLAVNKTIVDMSLIKAFIANVYEMQAN